MNMRHKAQFLWLLSAWLLALALGTGTVLAAGNARVLLVVGRGVSDDAQQALSSAIASDAEAIDPSEYQRLARAKGLLATCDAALQRVAPSVRPDLIVVATKAGNRLHLEYRDGTSGDVLDTDSLPAGHRSGALAKLRERVKQRVHKLLGASSYSSTQPPAAEPIAELPELPAAGATQPPIAPADADADDAEAGAEPRDDDDHDEAVDVEAQADASAETFLFELSAGVAGATRDSELPTRLGEHQLNTGLFPGAAIGLRLGGMLGPHALLRASADYRTSLGLQGVESQRATEMSTPLRSHGVGFGIEPGYRFGAARSLSLIVHLGWYFRGLRPIAPLALPEMSWHAAVIRPELHIPVSSSISLRLAPELLVVAGLETSLPDASGIAHTGVGFGGELSLDVRLTTLVGLRIEYRESHVALGTAWARSLSDVERFGALRVVLRY
jgi:hypothetical protein